MATPGLDQTRYRLAHYYLRRLQAADTAYRRGQASHPDSLAMLNQDWAHIAHWQSWAAAAGLESHAAARLCATFPQAGAEVLITRQTPQERIDWLDAGLRAARRLGDASAEGTCLFRMAWAIHKQARLEPAEATARAALACATALGDSLLIGQSLHLLGEIMVRRGEVAQAERLHRRSLRVLRAIDARAPLAEVYFSLSEHAYYRGDFGRAREYALRCYQIQTALGLNPATTNNLNCVAIFCAEAGDLEAGEAYVRQSLEVCRHSHAQSTLAHALKTWAGFLMLRKQWAPARQALDESLQIADRMGEAWLVPDILLFSGRLAMYTGDLERAEEESVRALGLARAMGYQITIVEALVNLAHVLVTAEHRDAAAAALREGFQLAQAHQIIVPLLYGLFVAARLAILEARFESAASVLGFLTQHPGTECAARYELPALRSALEGQLGAQRCAEALARGRSFSLEQALQRAIG